MHGCVRPELSAAEQSQQGPQIPDSIRIDRLVLLSYDGATGSICTGEKTAGFQDRKTGRFEEVMLIRSDADLQAFMEEYGITEQPETVY